MIFFFLNLYNEKPCWHLTGWTDSRLGDHRVWPDDAIYRSSVVIPIVVVVIVVVIVVVADDFIGRPTRISTTVETATAGERKDKIEQFYISLYVPTP